MNNSLNEYLRFNFELNIELNQFLARFNVKMNNQNVPPTPTSPPCHHCPPPPCQLPFAAPCVVEVDEEQNAGHYNPPILVGHYIKSKSAAP